MTGIGTLVNAGAIIAGSCAGIALRRGLPEHYKTVLLQGAGLSVLFVGISGVLQHMLKIGPDGITRENIMIMIVSLCVGGLAGEMLGIEKRLDAAGEYIRRKFSPGDSRFTEGFVSASLVFCVGAMAIVGSIEDGLAGNHDTLFAKALLDGIISAVLASGLGIGVAFSALPILLYQGGITFAAAAVGPVIPEDSIALVSLVGSVLITAIGLNVLGLPRIRVGNLLPAAFIPLAWKLISWLTGR